jgi:hypothetical protein
MAVLVLFADDLVSAFIVLRRMRNKTTGGSGTATALYRNPPGGSDS